MTPAKIHYTYKDIESLCGTHKFKKEILKTKLPHEITCGNCSKIFHSYNNLRSHGIPHSSGKNIYAAFDPSEA